MQYNLVVSTNKGAARLWKKHGFEVVGTLPKAFCHSQLGYVDASLTSKDGSHIKLSSGFWIERLYDYRKACLNRVIVSGRQGRQICLEN